jgi:lysozyme
VSAVFKHILPWLIVFGIGWMAGDRYGAPAWMSDVAGQGFGAVETAAGGAFGDLFERVSGPVPGTERDPSEEGDEGASEEEAPNAAESADGADAASAAGVRANRNLTINEAGLTIIKDSEGLRLEPYSAGGYDYIGYGHQIKPGESFTSITEAEAEALLRDDLAYFEAGVRDLLTAPANENEFSAMVSLAYNKGLGGFSSTGVLAKFNAGDKAGAADDFRNHTGRDGPVPHLVERRERERLLFLKPV